MTDDERIDGLEKSPESHILEWDLRQIDWPYITPTELRAIEKASTKRARGLTMRRALQSGSTNRTVKQVVRRFVDEYLAEIKGLSSVDRGVMAFLESASHDQMVQWAIEHHVRWGLCTPISMFSPDNLNPAARDFITHWSHYDTTLQQLSQKRVQQSGTAQEVRQYIAAALETCLRLTREWTQTFEEKRAALLPTLKSDAVGRWTRTGLDTLQRQVDAGEVGLRLSTPTTLRQQARGISVADWTFWPELPWDGTLPREDDNGWTPRAVDPFSRALAADALFQAIDALHATTRPAKTLRDAINMPSWHRALAKVDEHLMPADVSNDDNRVLVYRIEETLDGLDIEVGSAVPTKNGSLRARAEVLESKEVRQMAGPDDRPVLRVILRVDAFLSCAWPAADALVGHPRVIRRSNRGERPLPVRRSLLGLSIDREGDTVSARWTVGGTVRSTETLLTAVQAAEDVDDGLLLLDDSGLTVVPCSPELRDVMVAMGRHFEAADAGAAGPLLTRLTALNALVDVTLGDGLRGEEVPGDERLVVRARFDGGLWLSIGVRPLPELSTHRPGEGPSTLHSMRDGQPVYTNRNLADEVTTAHGFAESLGLLAESEPFTWVLDDLNAALTAVHRLADSPHRLELDGTLPRTAALKTSNVTVRVRKDRGWFTVGGSAASSLGDIDLDALLTAVDDGVDWVSTGKGYVQLSQAVKDAVSGLNATRSHGQTALSAVHVPLLQTLSEAGVTVDGVEEWLQISERVHEAATLTPEIPATLNGTLRSYQTAGFQWMARLAHWAPGAVLADDMGLGKTIQSIALLLRRASDGPALVVAPTSVGFNWLAELARFAPSLNAVSYRGSDREQHLDGLAAGTVLVTSYGILVRDAEALADVPFHTVIFDEAQALKNPASRRAKAASELDAAFRLALSGTPVENHVDDLWSVFACTARGLLGSHAAFRERWAKPIDNGDIERRKALARVVSPFLLRRTKAVVAPELPARTEVVHRVELSKDHRALYERSRLLALARIQNADPKTARFKVLAELTRLRQMAADPRLTDPTSPVVGSKVRHLVRRLEDLRETGDKALVFSTFVSHLTLAREALEAQGFRIVWLTGSTAAEARATAVASFQDGDADVFLLSTKAGGTGLNLTAASYVFHLDPWWNPAAEDQATDRAHRIGQDKPVTVYRLIAADTVEERILAMQAEKRELMDALLSDSDKATPLSLDALRDLLSETSSPVDDDEPPPSKPKTSKPKTSKPKTSKPKTSKPKAAALPAALSAEDWLESALETLEQTNVSKASRQVYANGLKYFHARSTEYSGTLGQRYAQFLADDSTPTSRRSTVRAAWRKVQLPTE